MKPQYALHDDAFIIKNFNQARPFASFLPGIAGEQGKPMWVFYSNRGQCIASFGIRNKNGAMLEFYPANKAYSAVPIVGFRTFLRVPEKKGYYEPFALHPPEGVQQELHIRTGEVEVVETYPKWGLRVRMVAFNAPNEDVPVLVRMVRFENLTRKPLTLEVLDGLPRIVPFGLNETLLKQMSRTMEAFSEVLHTEDRLPFYKLKVEPSDKPEMEMISGGFFTFSVLKGQSQKIVVDADAVFGTDTTYLQPMPFAAGKKISAKPLRTESITNSAFSTSIMTIPAGGSETLETYWGQADSWEQAAEFRRGIVGISGYAASKREENAALIDRVTESFGIHSDLPILEAYSRQTFLDNTLRGGQPFVVQGSEGSKVFHYFSRKHGDMERDYNFFELAPTYLSQGNGNFRDVNQNRRSELWLFPGVGEANIETFFNLLQLDGFNPLVINFERFVVPETKLESIRSLFDTSSWDGWHNFLTKPFIPGALLEALSEQTENRNQSLDIFRRVLLAADKIQDAAHGEGFWIDHWTYNLDLLESYAAVYPDKLRNLFVDRRDFTYFDNDHVVQPRAKKTVRRADGAIRQMHAVIADPEKQELLRRRTENRNAVRTRLGTGGIYRTSLLAKVLGLLTVKAASLDPFGVGLEMEAEKPGWCDALNGMPGIFGSSVNESFELRRWVQFLSERLDQLLPDGESHKVAEEVAEFLKAVREALALAKMDDFYRTWDALTSLKERFREKTRLGVTGEESELSKTEIQSFLTTLGQVLDAGLEQAFQKDGLCVTYFINEVVDSQPIPAAPSGPLAPGEKAVDYVKALKFKQKAVSPFLEGPVHALRAQMNPKKTRKLYEAVRASDLYDRKLGMYRMNVPLTNESFEIGRNKIFSPGWLENESVFLHMAYKYLLEVLRSGMSEEFYADIKKGLVAFQNPDVYGRSTLENSSFIASSRFPDARVHGTGFVARLTGATAEWISMVFHMALGREPFQWVNGELRFVPKPTLAGWLFSRKAQGVWPKGTFGVKLFGTSWVIFENPSRKDTFAGKGLHPTSFLVRFHDGREERFEGPYLPEAPSLDLRDGKVSYVLITLR